MYWAQGDLGSNYLKNKSWDEPHVCLYLGIDPRVPAIYSKFLKNLRQFVQVFIGKSRTAFAGRSEHVIAFVIGRKKQRAVGSSSPSPARERSHNSWVNAILHFRFVVPFVFDSSHS